MPDGYETEPSDVQALLHNLCGDLLAEPDPLIRYSRLTAEQTLYDALVSAIKRERGRALAEMKTAGNLTWEQLAEAAQLGTYQRAQKLVAAYQPEDTMTMLDLSQTATAVIARARSNSGLTAAEFDYDIATHYDQSVNGVGGEFSPLGNAAHEIAREQHVDPARLWHELQPELQAYARRCKDRKYSGWSSAARSRGQRIAYAD